MNGWAYQLGSWKEKAFVPTLDDLKAEEPAQKPGRRHRRTRSRPRPRIAPLPLREGSGGGVTAAIATAVESREYPARPIVGIGVVVLRPREGGGAEVLLVRRGKPPNIGAWSAARRRAGTGRDRRGRRPGANFSKKPA